MSPTSLVTKPKDKPAKPGDKKPAKCTPFSVSVAITLDTREIHFGITKGCNKDNTAFWTIDFILKVKKGSEMKTRVEVHIVIGKDTEKEKAEQLAAEIKKNKKLDDERIDLLQTDVADRALQVPPKDAQNDPQLKGLLMDVL